MFYMVYYYQEDEVAIKDFRTLEALDRFMTENEVLWDDVVGVFKGEWVPNAMLIYELSKKCHSS